MAEGQQKEDLKKAIGVTSGKATWFEDFAKTEATTNFETIVKTADSDTKLQDTLNNATGADKTTIETYFTTMGTTTYEAKIGDNTYTVTQDLKAAKPYTVKEKTS